MHVDDEEEDDADDEKWLDISLANTSLYGDLHHTQLQQKDRFQDLPEHSSQNCTR